MTKMHKNRTKQTGTNLETRDETENTKHNSTKCDESQENLPTCKNL